MKCYRYYESGRPIYLIIMRYNPLLSNYKADGRLQLRYRVTADCGTFHDLLMVVGSSREGVGSVREIQAVKLVRSLRAVSWDSFVCTSVRVLVCQRWSLEYIDPEPHYSILFPTSSPGLLKLDTADRSVPNNLQVEATLHAM